MDVGFIGSRVPKVQMGAVSGSSVSHARNRVDYKRATDSAIVCFLCRKVSG